MWVSQVPPHHAGAEKGVPQMVPIKLQAHNYPKCWYSYQFHIDAYGFRMRCRKFPFVCLKIVRFILCSRSGDVFALMNARGRGEPLCMQCLRAVRSLIPSWCFPGRTCWPTACRAALWSRARCAPSSALCGCVSRSSTAAPPSGWSRISSSLITWQGRPMRCVYFYLSAAHPDSTGCRPRDR